MGYILMIYLENGPYMAIAAPTQKLLQSSGYEIIQFHIQINAKARRFISMYNLCALEVNLFSSHLLKPLGLVYIRRAVP